MGSKDDGGRNKGVSFERKTECPFNGVESVFARFIS